MKEFWLADNRDVAEKDTLHRLMGKLECMKEFGKEPTCDELLKWIDSTVQREEARMNERFPNKAR